MPIAAVPAYLGDAFEDASPGMRFGMYLKIWGVDRRSRDKLWTTHPLDYEVRGARAEEPRVMVENKRSAIDAACALGGSHSATMTAWHDRQQRLAAPLLACGQLARFEAKAVAPFATGLGNEHPTENGFAFLWPYGLPYLPGSGVKGVLRAAARELGWPDEHRIALFGSDPPRNGDDGGAGLRRGALVFWDVLPSLADDALRVDVMTPHQTHYHQPRAGGGRASDKNTAGSSSPHDSGQPTPIYFLTVPPGSVFSFHVGCDPKRLPAELGEGARWRELLAAAFEHAFEWLGFGAKTAVGYGAMKRDAEGEQRAAAAAEKVRADREEAAARDKMTAAQRTIADYEKKMHKRAQEHGGRRTHVGQTEYQEAQKLAKAAQSPDWTADDRRAAADAIERWGARLIALEPKELRKKLGLAALRAQG
jgi:CRISPR-associated protein Cmr6